MFKYLLAITAMFFFSATSFSEDYYYNNELINKKKFENLYKQFKDYFYTDGKKIFDMRTSCTDKHVPDANELIKLSKYSGGTVDGEVHKVIDKNTLLLKIGKNIVCVSESTDTAGLEENAECSLVLTPAGSYLYGKKKLMKFNQIVPVSKEIFQDYIKTRKLYQYKKVEEKVPAQTLLCPKCKGKGSYLQGKGKGKSGWVKCKICKTKGTVVGKFKQQITWEREDID